MPVRFTHLQNHPTMLSGIKVGRKINSKVTIAVSVYHSFYLNSFKSEANLVGFDPQPRLFINCTGIEMQYSLYKRKKLEVSIQALGGWGFMKYDLKMNDFKSRQLNYFTIEPSIALNHEINPATYVGIGAGYRSVLTKKGINYSSSVSSGEIPVHQSFPNGLVIVLTIAGYF